MDRKRPIILESGAMATDSENLTFCMAPWTHTFLSPQAERRLCCTSREEHQFQKQYIDTDYDADTKQLTADDFAPAKLTDHWNSEYLRNIRLKLLNGQTLPQCEVCNSDKFNHNNYRKWFNYSYGYKLDEVLAQTDETGRTTMPVVSYDYRVSNLCNFKCRMCGELFSSSIEAEKKKNNLWNPTDQPFMQKDIKAKMQKFQIEVAEEEFMDAIKSGVVEEIYFAGGEPMMIAMHWNAIDYLVKHDMADQCTVRYNTNLSNITYQDKSLYEYLKHFKNWQICASIDAVGDIGEYIRKGLVWDNWLANFKAGMSLPNAHDNMIIDLTITGPGMLSLKEIYDLSKELDVRIETKHMFAFHPGIVFSPRAWPRNVLNTYVDDLLAYMHDAGPKQASLIGCLKSLKTQPNFEEEWPDTYHNAFIYGKKHHEGLDKIRNEKLTLGDIYATHDDLNKWWNYDK
jgi:hypothetical protein